MRTLSADVSAAQKAKSSKPYISISLTRSGDDTITLKTTDVPNRIKFIRMIEESYSSIAVIVLSNPSRDLATDLSGYKCEIDYGYLIAGVGDTTGGETQTLWVKQQFSTSKMGDLDTVLYCEGTWNMLAEMQDIAAIINSGSGSAPYYEVDYTGLSKSIYDIVGEIIAAPTPTMSLIALGAEDDSIIDTLEPDYAVNNLPFENAAELLYRLINMTKIFVRVERGSAFRVKYPGGYSSFDYTYTSDGV